MSTATERRPSMDHRPAVMSVTTGTFLVLLAVSGTNVLSCSRRAPERLDHVRAVRTQGTLPRHDPVSPLWNDAPEFEATLAPQNVVAPMLQQPSVTKVRVRALHDGTWIAFRLEWQDPTRDDVLGPSRFSDAVAVQIPRDRGQTPSPMMGHAGAPVRILYWKAAWQQPDMLAALHPNHVPGHYPFEAAQGEARTSLATLYSPAQAVDNSQLRRPNGVPVFAGEAEGFGTLSPARSLEADGRGVHRDGHWYVVVAMPIGDLGNSPLAPGQQTSVAFAVWEGSAQNTGSRKMRSENWVRLTIDGGQ